MTTFEAYLLVSLDNFKIMSGLMFALSLFGAIVFGIRLEIGKKGRELFMLSAAVCVSSFLVCALLPSTRQAFAIYALPRLANSEQLHSIGDKGMKLVDEQLGAWLEDLRGRKK